MLHDILSPEELAQWHHLIDSSQKIVLCAHQAPDGDAVGSALGLREYLLPLGKEVAIVLPNVFPDFLRWMPGTQDIIFYSNHPDRAQEAIDACDLIVCLDFNSLARLKDLAPLVEACKAPRLLIDHHLDPQPIAELVVSHPEMCATCEVVFNILWQLGQTENLSRAGAICLYTGMMTDTGSFTYNSSRPEIFFIIGQLLQKGFNKDKIYRKVFNNYSRERIQLMGYILYSKLKFYRDLRAAVFSLTKQEMKHFHFMRGDAEGFVNLPLSVRGTLLSISLREDTERPVIRVSLRSVDDFPCNKMAEEFFNGGGHLNASGGELPMPMEEALKVVDRAVEAYRPLLEMRKGTNVSQK